MGSPCSSRALTSITLPFLVLIAPNSTIIHSFGYSTAVSQLLTVPPYVLASKLNLPHPVWLLLITALASHPRLYVRLHVRQTQETLPLHHCWASDVLNWLLYQRFQCAIRCEILWYLFLRGGKLQCLPRDCCMVPQFPFTTHRLICSCRLGNNLAGQYKRGVGMALHIGIGNFSGAIAANIYRSRDSPRFILGHALELMFVGLGFICVPIAILAYTRINAKRDEIQRQRLESGEKDRYTPQQLREMGDRAPDFRYTL